MLSFLAKWLIVSTLFSTAFASADTSHTVSSGSSVSAPLPSSSSSPDRPLPEKMFVAYWSVWAQPAQVPTADQLKGVTHVVLEYGTFTAETITALRAVTDAKITASFGGWNLDLPFRPGVKSENREQFATNVATFVETFHLDGADIDWEFPVDGSQTYRLATTSPDYRGNEGGVGGADAQNFVDFMTLLRTKLPNEKTLSVAVPARDADMIAYKNGSIISGLDMSVDYWKLMTYDMMNRRDNISQYHSGAPVVDNNFDFYVTQKHINPSKVIVGFPLYAKWFDVATPCTADPPIGCDLGVSYENDDGSDPGRSGVAVWNNALNTKFSDYGNLNATVTTSWGALQDYTNDVGSSAWYDAANKIFWTWMSPADITKTCEAYKSRVRGMGVWSLNQDSPGFPHLKAISDCLAA